MTTANHKTGRPGLATNILWTWALVAINLSTALFVGPLLVRRLGDQAYGLWALVFSVVGNFGLLDMGIQSALLKYVAQHLALGDRDGLDRTLQTGVAYFASVGCLLLLVTFALAPFGPRFFQISPELSRSFVHAFLIVGVGWAIGVGFQCFTAGLEAAQRFDLSNRAIILASFVRFVSIVVLLQLGYGLTAAVGAAVGARLLQCAIAWVFFRRVFPDFRFNPRAVSAAMFRPLMRFGIHTVPSTIGYMLLTQGPAVVIGHAMPVQYVGYYALPGRLTLTVLDLVYRAAGVTTARSAELSAQGRTEGLIRLGVMSNRYSLMVFIPFAALLLTYGDSLFSIWLTPAFAHASAPLLPVFVTGGLAEAAQFNSGSILYGLGKHKVLSMMLLLEAGLSLCAIAYFTSIGEFRGAAIGATAVLILNRGCATPVLLCRELSYPVGRYMAEVAGRPMAVMLATTALLWFSRATWLPGDGFLQIVAAGAVSAASCVILAGRYCVLKDHQTILLEMLHRKAPFIATPARHWLGVRSTAVAA